MVLNVGPQQWWIDQYGPPQRSVRFNSADSAYLSRTPASAGNRKTWTWAGWVKRNALGSGTQAPFTSSDGATATTAFFFGVHAGAGTADAITFYTDRTGAITVTTSAVFRDTSAWYHLLIAVDTTQATSANRVKIYVNNVQQTLSGTYPAQNFETEINRTSFEHGIGRHISAGWYLNAYLADIHFIDGQALDPTSFGFFDDNGIWQHKAFTGSYGTNGFHLPFSDNSTAAALGTDTSGNGNDWTVNNIAPSDGTTWSDDVAGTPYTTNVPSRSFDGILSTWSTAANGGSLTWTPSATVTISSSLRIYAARQSSNTNITVTFSDSSTFTAFDADNTFKWYTITNAAGKTISSIAWNHNNDFSRIAAIEVDGVILVDGAAGDSLVDVPTNGIETDTGAGGEVRGNYATLNPLAAGGGAVITNGNLDVASDGSSTIYTVLGTIGMSAGKWYFEFTINTGSTQYVHVGIAKNNVGLSNVYLGQDALGWGYGAVTGQTYNNGVPTNYGAGWSAGDIIGVAFDADNGTLVFYKNGVSQGTAFSGLTSGPYLPAVSDTGTGFTINVSTNFGQRPFAYTAPSGFKALCTANLDAPVVTKPSEYMDVVTYTGNGSTQTISGLEFSPDFVWIKNRSHGRDNNVYDIVRGATKLLSTNGTTYDVYNGTGAEQTVSGLTAFNSDGFDLGSDNVANQSTYTYAAWCWDAGSSTVTNTDGSITSSVRANPSAGFSIVTWTGTGAAGETVGHGLGVAPRLYIIKSRSTTQNWVVGTTALDGSLDIFFLNTTNGKVADAAEAVPTSSVFTVANANDQNALNVTFVAYCFAPVDGYSSFGSYTGNGSADGPFVFTNHRPRWILIKRTDTTGNWTIIDTSREGYNVDNDPLYPNLSNAEGTTDLADILSNGFKLRTTDASVNANTGTYIYASFAENPFALNARAR